jgi:hypothetical protein
MFFKKPRILEKAFHQFKKASIPLKLASKSLNSIENAFKKPRNF